MKDNARHLRWYLGMAVALLCLMACRAGVTIADGTSVQAAEVVGAVHDTSEASCASLSEKQDDMLHAVREMGQWGIPSASITMQGAAGRVLTLSEALQRINRLLGALFTNELSCSNGLTEALRHTLLTKRFHSGYYIYYRCQMRC